MLQNQYLHIYPSQKYQQHFRMIKKKKLYQNANIFEHFKLANYQRQTTYISSYYVKLKLIYTHTMHFLYLCSSIKYLWQNKSIFHQINKLNIRNYPKIHQDAHKKMLTTLQYIDILKKTNATNVWRKQTCFNISSWRMFG